MNFIRSSAMSSLRRDPTLILLASSMRADLPQSRCMAPIAKNLRGPITVPVSGEMRCRNHSRERTIKPRWPRGTPGLRCSRNSFSPGLFAPVPPAIAGSGAVTPDGRRQAKHSQERSRLANERRKGLAAAGGRDPGKCNAGRSEELRPLRCAETWPGQSWIELDGHEAQPVAAVADIVRFQLAQESLAEAYRAAHLFGSEARQPGGVLGGYHSHVFQTGGAGERKCPPLNLAGIHQIEHADLQSVKEPVHRFQAQPAAGIEEVRKMALLETGLARQTAASQFPSSDPRPDMRTKSVLQVLEFHVNDISERYTCTFVIFLEQ